MPKGAGEDLLLLVICLAWFLSSSSSRVNSGGCWFVPVGCWEKYILVVVVVFLWRGGKERTDSKLE